MAGLVNEQLDLGVCPVCFGGGKVFDPETGGDRPCACTRPPIEEKAHARVSDPWTSHAAAASIEPVKLRASQEAVLAAFRATGPMCHENLILFYGSNATRFGWPIQSPSGIRTRAHELHEAGLLEDTGDVVTLTSGRKSKVWAAA